MCGGTGWKDVLVEGTTRVARCDCFTQGRAGRLLAAAKIPARYERCDLATYETSSNPSFAAAKLTAERFVDQYPVDKMGLMFIGSIGIGKTHLAVATIKDLVRKKGIPCLFCEYRELLKQIQDSYNKESETTELAVLKPVFDAEVLVLDELGAVKPSQWVWDTVTFILNTRYNGNRSTLITTNLLDEPALAASSKRSVMSADTLGDRIGERMRSRLHEMCRIVKMEGPDFRERFRRAGIR